MKKLRLLLVTMFMLVMVGATNRTYAAWTLGENKLPTGYRFQYGSYGKQNYMGNSVLWVSNGVESRNVFCIQQAVMTKGGVVYDEPTVFPSNISTTSISEAMPMPIKAGNDTGYYNMMSDTVKRSLNIAYAWWKYNYPTDNNSYMAAQWFIWSQTTGNVSAELEARADSGGTVYPGGIGAALDDGYKYIDVNYDRFQNDSDDNGILSSKGLYRGVHTWNGDSITWDEGTTRDILAKYVSLANYYELFNENEQPNFMAENGTKNTVLPGETVSFVDRNSVFQKAEWSVDQASLPKGITAVKQENRLIVTVDKDFKNAYMGDIVLKRFANTDGRDSVRIYGNGSNQLLFEGYMPEKTATLRIKNYKSASIMLGKISSSSGSTVVYNGSSVDQDLVDDEIDDIMENIKSMTKTEVQRYFEDPKNKIIGIEGVEFKLYTDEKCKKTLKININGVEQEVTLKTDGSGLVQVNDIPLGLYYLKEEKCPKEYIKSTKPIEVELTAADVDAMVYKIMPNPSVAPELLNKTDIFSGEAIPKCKFEIKDKNGEVVFYGITNENGDLNMPLDKFTKGETYTFTEIEAPKMYELNKEPHEFLVDYYFSVKDELVWTPEPIEITNVRKTAPLKVRKVDEETGEALAGCVFSIALWDEEANDYVINPKTGEMVYLVKDAVTDENGEWSMENAYYGTYKFVEIKAPEGYELKDDDLNGYVFTIDSKDGVVLEVVNTSDIAVYAISAMLLMSVAGIVYVVRKNAIMAK